MKNITDKIFESKQDLCPEVQNEFGNDYAYQSFAIKKSKYQYGFLTYDQDQEFYSVIAFNEDSGWIENFVDQYNLSVEELLDCKVGNYIDGTGFNIIRIW